MKEREITDEVRKAFALTDLYKVLSEEEREEFLHAYENNSSTGDRAEVLIEYIHYKPSSMLYGMFVWWSSKQGASYWVPVANRLIYNENKGDWDE